MAVITKTLNRKMRLCRVCLAASMPLVSIAAFGTFLARGSSAAGLDCGAPTPPVDVQRLGEISARLRLQQPDELVFQLGAQRGTSRHDLPLELVDPLSILDAAVRPLNGESLAVASPRLVDDTTHNQIPSDKIHAQAIFQGSENEVSIEICLDLKDPEGFGGGSYEGVARLTDPRFTEVDVPIQVNLKNGSWIVPLLSALVGGALGAGWATVSLIVANIERDNANRQLPRRQARRLLVVSLLLGAGAGLWYFVQKYVDTPAFRGFTSDWIGVGTAAFVGAATLYPIATGLETFWRVFIGSDRESPLATTPPGEQTTTSISKEPTDVSH